MYKNVLEYLGLQKKAKNTIFGSYKESVKDIYFF